MEFILHPDECGKLFYVCGNSISYIPNEDALNAIQIAAEKTETHLPHIEIGSPAAKWGFRFFEACGQAALYHEIVDGETPAQPAANTPGITIEQLAKAFVELGKMLVEGANK